MDIINLIDHSILRPETTVIELRNEIEKIYDLNLASICVKPCHVINTRILLQDIYKKNTPICTVIGFPHGSQTTETKCFEINNALINGVSELDIVMNVGNFKESGINYLNKEFNSILKITNGHIIKVILETSLLTNEEIAKASSYLSNLKVDYIKTSTGFNGEGANEEVIKIIKNSINSDTKIKASGGIRDYATTKKFIELGCSRIGTSNTIKIIEEYKNN